MKFLLSICLFFISRVLFSQTMFVSKDSAAIFSNEGIDASIRGYLHYGDTVQVIKKTKKASMVFGEETSYRGNIFSTWTQVGTQKHIMGWIPYNQLKSTLIPPPPKIIGVTEGNALQDELYPIGWSKNAFAYIIEGYIDGAVDGLTVRYCVKNFKGKYTDSLVDYTSYIDPIDAMWKQQAFDIQNSLERNKITPLTQAIATNRSPILVNNKDTLQMYWDMNTMPIIIKAAAGGVELNVLTLPYSVRRILILGSLVNPLDTNKIVVMVAFITDSTSHLVDIIPIDLLKFKKKKK